jgi:hypothetical protein
VTTARDIINLALRDSGVLGVGQTARAEDINEGLMRLNNMIGQWAATRFLVFHLIDVWCQATGAPTYFVGPGGDLEMPYRPNRLEGAFVRQGAPAGGTPHEFTLDSSITDGSDTLAPSFGGVNAIDLPLTLMESREEYNAIALKGNSVFPSAAYYDPAMPFGRFYVWGLPPSQYELHILVRAPLQTFSNLSDNVLLPPEYMEAIHYNLIGRLQLAYGLQVNPGVVALARSALQTIRAANAQIPLMRMPAAVMGRHGGFGIGAFGFGGSAPVPSPTPPPDGPHTSAWDNFNWDDGTVWA